MLGFQVEQRTPLVDYVRPEDRKPTRFLRRPDRISAGVRRSRGLFLVEAMDMAVHSQLSRTSTSMCVG